MTTETLASWLIAQTWQVAVAIVVVGLVAQRLGRTRPHLAHVLWLVVLLKCFTPPVWTSPSGVFCWLLPAALEERGIDVELDDGEAGESIAGVGINSEAAIQGNLLLAARAEPLVDPARSGGRTIWMQIAAGAGWKRALLLLWLAGASVVLLIGAVKASRFFHRLQASGLIESPALSERVERLRRDLGVTRRVRVLTTPTGIGPVVVGLFAPTIYLPKSLVDSCSLETLEPILAHELVHQRRGDLWLCWLQWLARGIWWFHPLVAWACRRWNREIERCCDEETVAGMNYAPGRYARSLLEVLERKQALRAAPVFPGVRPLEITSQRLERIMRLGQGSHRRTPWWCWACLVVVACLVLPGAAFVAEAKDRRKNRRASAPSAPASSENVAVSRAATVPVPATDTSNQGDSELIQFVVEVWTCDSKTLKDVVLNGFKLETPAFNVVACERDEVRRCLESLRSDPRTEQLMAPRAIAHSGRTVQISNVLLHPFVVGYADRQPIVDTKQTGLQIDLMGRRNTGGDLELSFEARQSEIAHVEESKDKEGRPIQIPQLRNSNVSTRVTLGPNQLFVALGPKVGRKDGANEQQIIVVECLTLPPTVGVKSLRVYHVADLVVPIPATADPHPAADFEPLVKLIKATINPEVWTDVGSGRIETVRENMSLVVNADAETHEKMAELLSQLRRLQDIQIVFETRLLRPDAELVQAASREQWQWREPDRIAAGPPVATLDAVSQQRLWERIAASRSEVLQAPKVTCYNGQSLRMNLPIPDTKRPQGSPTSAQKTDDNRPSEIAVRIAAVASLDRKRLRLTIAPGEAARGDQLLSELAVRELDDGATLVVDLTNDVRWREWLEHGPLARLPEAQQVLSQFSKSDNRPPLWLVATPRIIIVPSP